MQTLVRNHQIFRTLWPVRSAVGAPAMAGLWTVIPTEARGTENAHVIYGGKDPSDKLPGRLVVQFVLQGPELKRNKIVLRFPQFYGVAWASAPKFEAGQPGGPATSGAAKADVFARLFIGVPPNLLDEDDLQTLSGG